MAPPDVRALAPTRPYLREGLLLLGFLVLLGLSVFTVVMPELSREPDAAGSDRPPAAHEPPRQPQTDREQRKAHRGACHAERDDRPRHVQRELDGQAGEEQRGLHNVAGIEAAGAEKVARMIQSHDRHDQAAQNVYRNYPRRSATFHGKASRRGNWRD